MLLQNKLHIKISDLLNSKSWWSTRYRWEVEDRGAFGPITIKFDVGQGRAVCPAEADPIVKIWRAAWLWRFNPRQITGANDTKVRPYDART
ncbi:MAG: hypothetical protein EA369_00430 [Bradymonadales bacterium]|nr:MAG: hypothetical protein EA369_00430 [Bradymonadales bacterium]